MTPMGYDITIEREPGRYLAVLRFDTTPQDLAGKMGAAFGTVAAHLARAGVPITGPAATCYEMDGDVFHVASGFFVDGPFEPGEGVEPLRLPEVDVATTTHVGPYDELGRAYDAIREGAPEHGRRVDESAAMWEEYLDGPQTPPAQRRTIVHWPLLPT